MRINSKGQVTIPAALREKHGLHEGDEVEVVEDAEGLRIVRSGAAMTRGQRMVERLRGTARPGLRTDELMALLRDD